MTDKQTESLVEDLKPAQGTINIEKLLDNIKDFIEEHAILPDGASTAITLWCLATFNINNFRIFPRLLISSPEKRCGKSTVLDLIEGFVAKPLMTSNMSQASIYRVIELCQPTLIIDEADTFVAGGDNGLTGIINSGHARSRAYVLRCEGTLFVPRRFSTWSPMALACIGDLQTTIMDRSVIIPLRRKTVQETVERLTQDLIFGAHIERRQLLKWSEDNTSAIINNLIIPPDLGNDRAIDNWLPLFTLAKLVSDKWYNECEEAYKLLNTSHSEPDESTLLLSDIHDIFVANNSAKIHSIDIVTALVGQKDKPWCEIRNGRSLTQNGLAVKLKKFGIRPISLRHNGTTTQRGYELQQFTDTFKRYLP